MVQNLRKEPFQRESSLSIGELKEGFIEEAGPGESPMIWIKFGWKKERAFQEGSKIDLTASGERQSFQYP